MLSFDSVMPPQSHPALLEAATAFAKRSLEYIYPYHDCRLSGINQRSLVVIYHATNGSSTPQKRFQGQTLTVRPYYPSSLE